MCLRGSPTSHKLMFQQTSGIDQGTKDPVLCFKEFKVNNLMLRKGGTTEGLSIDLLVKNRLRLLNCQNKNFM